MNRKIVSAALAATMFWSVGAAFAATTLTQIGRSPFVRPPLASTEDLLNMVQNQSDDVRRGFEKAGRLDLYQPFVEQIQTADIKMVDMPYGTYFKWMFYKKNGSGAVRLSRDVTWGNETPFPAYRVDVVHEGVTYPFAIPLGCGNVALLDELEETSDIAPAPPVVPVNTPPVCRASVSPVSTYWGNTVTVDASGSTDSDGQVTGMTITALDANGQPLAREDVAGSLVGTIALPVGATAIQTSVIDNSGANATSQECITSVAGRKKMNFVVDAGGSHMFDPGSWLFARAGLEFPITERFSVLAMLGYAHHVDGDDGESAVLADVIGEYRIDRIYFDVGVGGWFSTDDNDTDYDDSQLDLILGAGVVIYGEPDSSNVSFFFEARNAFDELDVPRDCGRYGVGIRFKF